MDLSETGMGYVGWRHLVQDRDKWQVLVNTYKLFEYMDTREFLGKDPATWS
jgi:hypothetical protein